MSLTFYHKWQRDEEEGEQDQYGNECMICMNKLIKICKDEYKHTNQKIFYNDDQVLQSQSKLYFHFLHLKGILLPTTLGSQLFNSPA